MAIVKTRSAEPVRNGYMVTVHTGRQVVASNKGFGKPRMGGLINATVEGLASGGTGGQRLLTDIGNPVPSRVAELETKIQQEAERQRTQAAREFRDERKGVYEEQDKLTQEGLKIEKHLAEKADDIKTDDIAPKSVDIVDGRPVAQDFAPAEDLNDPTKLAKASKKTEKQVKEEAGESGDTSKPRADVKK